MAKKTFEEQMKRLEEVVALLEDEKTDLDTSIQLYEEGLKLSAALQKQLNVFEDRIEDLKKEYRQDSEHEEEL
ncbi:MAG: exodeoxyribonuclease VII small subunit [Erysipelotrichaceae bacterium]|nr:exodeoxyribonuclease VII small subunit [Erysipelotrichaceae bacterium]